MNKIEEMTIEDLKKIHCQYVFVYQALTQKNQYFVEEFEVAKDAIQTITKVANDIAAKIKELTPQPVVQGETSNEQK